MARPRGREADRSGLDVVEEAVHQLRTASAATLATYYAGAIPFVLAFLYFWADMSRSPFANQHLGEAALAMTGLFVWMKSAQALFARRMRAQLTDEPQPRWSLRQSVRVILVQAVIQPTGLFVLPLALVLMIPFAWVYAFYQNATALADPDSRDTASLVRKAWKHASQRMWQNHTALGIVLVFGFCAFLNLAIVSFSIPSLIKMLFGIETTFTRSPFGMLNSTFFATIAALTYLCVDPVIKTMYVVRCFYGDSLLSGEDLKADLQRFAAAPRLLAVLFVISVSISAAFAAQNNEPVNGQIPPAELNRVIDQVIQQNKYSWRMPRDANVNESEKGVITRFVEKTGEVAMKGIRAALNWLREIFQRMFGSGDTGPRGSSFGRTTILLWLLLAGILSAVLIILVRGRRQRRNPVLSIVAQTVHGRPDIADENVSADQLPEDGWTKLARELLDRGEFRLAMRAFYLAGLAHLATRNLIGIARFKSNSDYENELVRRGHAFPQLQRTFRENVSAFERIWYGAHEVNRELVDQFAANVDKLRMAA